MLNYKTNPISKLLGIENAELEIIKIDGNKFLISMSDWTYFENFNQKHSDIIKSTINIYFKDKFICVYDSSKQELSILRLTEENSEVEGDILGVFFCDLESIFEKGKFRVSEYTIGLVGESNSHYLSIVSIYIYL